jgi:hypothetical protein
MGEDLGKAEASWVGRIQQRLEDRRARRMDRRARRKAHLGSPDDAARRAEAQTHGQGGYFTTKAPPRL